MIDLEELKKAIFLDKTGDLQGAESIYLKLLEQEPDNHILLSTIGIFYVSKKDFEKASMYLKKACSIKETLGTVSAYGCAECEQGNFTNAARILKHALELGETPDIYNNLILSLFHIEQYAEAIKYTQIMNEKYPDNPNSINNKIKALTSSGELLEAEKLCVETIKKDPKSIGAPWFYLGYLKELIYSDDRQALECYKLALENGHRGALYNIGVSYSKLNDFENAEKYYKLMLEEYPNQTATLVSLGMCYMAQKRFKEGYDLFFQRDKKAFKNFSNNFWQPNQNLEEEVNVICDQGLGDHIHHARYLHALSEKVKQINVIANPILKSIFEKNFPFAKFIILEEINPDIQTLFITDLAYALDIDFENIPFAEGYLKSDTADIKSEKLKVGICWEAGAAGIRGLINRTINVKLLEPIFELENIQTYSFQVTDSMGGNEKYPQMINLAKDFKDFEDTAQALKAMDVLVSVDTSVAHMAGALGVKTYLMLPYTTDWRWFEDTKTSPWYKSVEIFKQTDPISWENVISEIVEKLKSFK